jgi:hypothetical protein
LSGTRLSGCPRRPPRLRVCAPTGNAVQGGVGHQRIRGCLQLGWFRYKDDGLWSFESETFARARAEAAAVAVGAAATPAGCWPSPAAAGQSWDRGGRQPSTTKLSTLFWRNDKQYFRGLRIGRRLSPDPNGTPTAERDRDRGLVRAIRSLPRGSAAGRWASLGLRGAVLCRQGAQPTPAAGKGLSGRARGCDRPDRTSNSTVAVHPPAAL